MSLRDKLLKKAIQFLKEFYGCQNFQVALDEPKGKHAYPEPAPIGPKEVIADLVCHHPGTSQTLILDVVEVLDYMESEEAATCWKEIASHVQKEGAMKFILLTYKQFGKEFGEALLREKLREALEGMSTKEIDIITYHKGKVQGFLELGEEEEEGTRL